MRGAEVETVTGVIVLKVTNPVDDIEGRVTLSTTTSENQRERRVEGQNTISS